MMRIGIAADHGGFELKVQLTAALKTAGYEVENFGAHELVAGDDYPDFLAPLARAVARGEDIRRILAVSWMTQYCQRTVHHAVSLAAKYRAKLSVIHVIATSSLQGWNLPGMSQVEERRKE